MFRYFAYFLILIILIYYKLEGYQVEYKLSSTNCNFTDITIRHWTTSLAMCAALCTQTAVFNGFAWKDGECALFDTCPSFCDSAIGTGDRWTLYCSNDATDNPPVPKGMDARFLDNAGHLSHFQITNYQDNGICASSSYRHNWTINNAIGLSHSLIQKALDCLEIFQEGHTTSEVYTIRPGDKTTRALCNMHTDGGGWTVFQRRLGGGVDFYRDWDEYRDGFGDPVVEHWLGNIYLHQLTTGRSCKLRIDMTDWSSSVPVYAKYDIFSVGDEESGFSLTVGGYSGTAGFDSMATHNGMKFTTKDRDLDTSSSGNCAVMSKGGFWYSHCHHTNLNGQYGNKDGFWEGITWKWEFMGYRDLKTTMMMVKCNNV